ncbi:MAG TPA: Mov34/MPN/PAD-1 family protein [Sphingomonadaceae bacterium]|nr:Mov34/MPN/PAD-1 family protein [Sphingomonadaceae bacterium]
MREARELRFTSADGRFGVVLAITPLQAMLDQAAASDRNETGGILIGRYVDSGAVASIAEATAKPADSWFGLFWFKRGSKGLKKLLEARWSAGEHYLGEWHFHPGGSPSPSRSDEDAMRAVAFDERYHCREPLLAILGGWPEKEWSVSLTVFPLMERPVPLFQVDPHI